MTSTELLQKKGLFQLRIDLADAFPEKTPPKDLSADDLDKYLKAAAKDAEVRQMLTQDNGESHFILLREMDSQEMIEIQSESETGMYQLMEKKIPDFIIDHSFETDKGDKTDNGTVLKILRMSGNLVNYVLSTWQTNSPLARRMRTEPG